MTTPETPPSRTIATLLSLLWPGVGQAYLGRYRRAAIVAVAPIALGFLATTTLPGLVRAHLALVGLALFVGALGIGVVAAIDAGITPVSSLAAGPRARRIKLTLAAWIVVVLVGTAARFAIRVFVLEAFQVPSSSMAPTILAGDRLLVDKTASSRLPSRGDVIVFRFPERKEQDFVKRAMALPGDTLRVEGGHAIVNGFALPSCLVGTVPVPHGDDSAGGEGDVFVEYLGARAYLIILEKGSPFGELEPTTFDVKPGEVYVLGDNRFNAHDSRMWFGGRGGGAPVEDIHGVAFVRWLAQRDGQIDLARMGGSMDEIALPREMAALAPGLAKCLASRPSIERATPPSR